jgi:hypothetical protein
MSISRCRRFQITAKVTSSARRIVPRHEASAIRPGARRLKKQEKARIYAAIERVEMRHRVSCANEPLTPYLQRRDVRRTKSRSAFGDQRGIIQPGH